MKKLVTLMFGLAIFTGSSLFAAGHPEARGRNEARNVRGRQEARRDQRGHEVRRDNPRPVVRGKR